MRLRKKRWARPELEASELVVIEPSKLKGSWKNEFNNSNCLYLELGCGRGQFIVNKAKLEPNVNFIAIDLKDEVLIYALRKIEAAKINNVRIVPMNIMGISEIFDKDEISKIFINFCNPWPKVSHNKRRLTHTKFLTEYKRFIKPRSEVWFKTDDLDLFNASQKYFTESGFNITFITYNLHSSEFKQNLVTEYEEKFTSLAKDTMFLIAKLID